MAPVSISECLQPGLPQLSHVLTLLAVLWLGRRGSPPERVLLWSLYSLVLLAWGAAGFWFGAPGVPEALTLSQPDPHLFRLEPLVELRTVDHVINLGLGGGLACAAAALRGVRLELLGNAHALELGK